MDTPPPFHLLSISDNHQYWDQEMAPPPAELSPVSRLAIELLGYILFLASSAKDSVFHGSDRSLMDVARFTAQVSRQWRAAALRCKVIWLGPALNWYSPYRWIQEVLERSDPLPVDVIIPFDATKRNPLVVSVALMQVSRIRILELELEPLAWWFITESKQLQKRAPDLEKFSLSINLETNTKRRVQVEEPRNMFSGYAPSLRLFQVQNCSIDLTQRIYGALNVLVIDKMQFITVSQLLNVLRHMKLLEKLHVTRAPDNVLFPDNFTPNKDVRDVHLLNLSELMVSATMSACANMMRSLVLPPSCSIVIDAQNAYHQGRDLDLIIRRMKEILSSWTCDTLTGRQSLLVGTSEIQYSVQGPEEDGISNREHPYISLGLSWHKQQLPYETLYTLFPLVTSAFRRCSQAPDTLCLMVTTEMPPNVLELLSPWLHKMRDIQAVEFQGHQTFAVFEPLLHMTDVHASPANSAGDVYLPYLGDATFVQIDFGHDLRHCWRRLVRIFKFRERAGSPLQEIDFVRCLGNFEPERQRIETKYGVMVKINGVDCADSDNEDSEGEDSDCTVQAASDVEE